MVSSTLRSYLRESKNRLAERAAFVLAMTRLSEARDKKDQDSPKPAQDGHKPN